MCFHNILTRPNPTETHSCQGPSLRTFDLVINLGLIFKYKVYRSEVSRFFRRSFLYCDELVLLFSVSLNRIRMLV